MRALAIVAVLIGAMTIARADADQTKLLGNLVYTAPGAKTPRVFRLDRASWKYIEEK